MENEIILNSTMDLNNKEFLDYLSKELEEAKRQIENGECIPLDKVMKEFGVKRK